MDPAQLQSLLARFPTVAAPDAVLRVYRYGDEDPDAGHLTGNRAGLVCLARACVEAALAPNVEPRDVVGPPARGSAADTLGTAALFDARSDLCLVGVTCEEPIERAFGPPSHVDGRVTPYVGLIIALTLSLTIVLAVVGIVTVVRWLFA